MVELLIFCLLKRLPMYNNSNNQPPPNHQSAILNAILLPPGPETASCANMAVESILDKMTSMSGAPSLGSKISLIAKSEIRYEGILYAIDTKDSIVALSEVRPFGTEDRPTDRPMAPRDDIYKYMIFRGTNIKDIRVCQPPNPHPTLDGGLPNDPAIVQHPASTTTGSVMANCVFLISLERYKYES